MKKRKKEMNSQSDKEILIQLIDQIKNKAKRIEDSFYSFQGFDLFNGNSRERVKLFKIYDLFIFNCQEKIKHGLDVNVTKFKEIFTSEIEELKKENKVHPTRMKQGYNISFVLYNFLEKLKYLDFETALNLNGNSLNSCNCQLRMTHSIEPKKTSIIHVGYGIDIYEKHKIFRCLECESKWIYYNAEVEIIEMKWKEWKEKEFPLVE
jgi:hypothetical protein